MKPVKLTFTLLAFAAATAAHAQVEVSVAPGAVITPAPAPAAVVVPSASPTQIIVNPAQAPAVVAPRGIDRVVVQGQLSIAPRIVTAVPVPATPPVTTTTTVQTTSLPRRVYNVERRTVTVIQNNQNTEMAYVTLPVLFVVDTADLLDDQSRVALQEMAGVINEISRTNPTAVFDVEGHTSTEGADEHNMELSTLRAKRVYDELTQRYSVPPTALSAHGYGENFPQFPSGTEDQLQQDRRVLVVRAR